MYMYMYIYMYIYRVENRQIHIAKCESLLWLRIALAN